MAWSPEWGSGHGRRARNDRGTVLVEFSLVFVIFVFICYALVAFGMAMNLKSNLTHAASEGARAAVGAGTTSGAPDPECDLTLTECQDAKRDAAIDRVKEAVDGQSSEVQQQVAAQLAVADNVKIDDCSAFATNGTPGAWCIRVAIPYDYDAHPIVPSAPGLGIVMPSVLRSVGVVQLSN